MELLCSFMFFIHSSYSKSHTLMLLSLIVIRMSLLGIVYIEVTLSIYKSIWGNLTPMTFVDHTKFTLCYIYKVHVHILRAQEQHVFIFSQLHSCNVFSSEAAQVVFLDKDTIFSFPDPKISVLRTRYDRVLL